MTPQIQEKQELPEFVKGIATAKDHASIAQRREFVIKTYQSLLGKLANQKGSKTIYNKFLDADVHLIMREGGKEATNRNAFNWQSAYAILELETIVKNAVPMDGREIFVPPKNTGNQKAHKYVNMAVLYYTFVDDEKNYMNFTVRLTLGIKSDGRHIQYSVNKIDTI
jgi:hypothetical protein